MEIQSQTIDTQTERIERLEAQHRQYLKAFQELEMRIEKLNMSTSKSKAEVEDEESFIEV